MRRGGVCGNIGELFRPLPSLQLCFCVDLSLSIYFLFSRVRHAHRGNWEHTKGAGGCSGGGTGLVLLSNKRYSLTMGRPFSLPLKLWDFLLNCTSFLECITHH